MTVVPGCRVRRNERPVDVGTVVRVEGEFVVVRWDHGRLRLTTVRLADIHDGRRPRSSRYSLVAA